MHRCNAFIADLWQSICHVLSVGSNKSSANLVRKKTRWLNLAFTAMIAITIMACGSGGGGGGGGTNGGGSSVPADFVVSGMVLAPGGSVAFLPQKNLFAKFTDILFSSAYAAISGLASVPDGTRVDLVRIDKNGLVLNTLATTKTTTGGSYSFNLTKLGLTTASDLVVQVFDSSNVVKMRAFVATDTVNIDPVSETAVGLVLEKSATSSLNNFTTQELADIVAAVNLLAMTKPLASGLDIETTVTAFKNAVAADANITSLIIDASATGQTLQGLGDIGNYFPFDQGNTWVYQGTEESGGITTPYTNTLQITGTKLINGITTTIFHETNSGNSGASEDYLVKDSQAISIYGNNDTSDFLTPLLVPFREYRFPTGLTGSFEAINRSGLSLPDIYPYGDGDGKPETVSVNFTVTVAGFETVIVPAGTYENVAKIVSNIAISIVYSSDGSTQTVLGTGTEWYAPGAGLVKSISAVKNTYGSVTDTTTTTEDLTNFVPPVPPTPPLVFSNISAGYDFACGITTKGSAYCWGYGFDGELGTGTTMSSSNPVAVVGGINFLSVAAGHSHACGIAATGVTYCWGGNFYGQLGDGTSTNSTLPVAVLTGVPFTSISVGRFHTCGLTQTGTAYCWGYNSDGELGYSSPSWPNPVPAAVLGGISFVSITAGGSHTCGLTTNSVAYCWGGNYYGQLGNTNSPQSTVPVIVTGNIKFASLETGYIHTCGITSSGTAYCWGRNEYGGLGNGTTTDSFSPVPVIGGLAFASISAGDYHTCGVTTNSVAYCWGNNVTGAGGNGTTNSPVTTPTAVAGGLIFLSLSAGGEVFTCGVAAGGSGYCWGSNNWGNLGIGLSGNKYVPTAIAPP